MSKRTRRAVEVFVLIVVLLGLLRVIPNYNYVRVSGPDGTTVIQHTGAGPHTIRVENPDGSFAQSSAW